MEGNIALGLKYVGAGLATLAMLGAALGVGNIFANFLDAAMRNPSAAPQQQTNLLIGFALVEALGILGFVIAILILFVVV
jgi:F-type H+-transporting ATPase subunit c